MEQKLRQAIKCAMKAKIADKENKKNDCIYQTRKNILETAQKIAKEKKTDITDSMIYDAAKKEIKQIHDLQEFCKGDVDKSRELNICECEAKCWLPDMISEDQIIEFINKNKELANNIGAMMKALKAEFGDRLDGKMANQLVKANL